MTHDYHEGLPGYDPLQLLHDGCGECEHRGEDVERALANMDRGMFERAWRRAFDRFASAGDHAAVGPVSVAEAPLLRALWTVQVQLERRGVPLVGHPPSRPPAPASGGLFTHTEPGGKLLKLKMSLDNFAFDDGEDGTFEVARILREAAIGVQERGIKRGGTGFLFDINGNQVGTWWIEEEA